MSDMKSVRMSEDAASKVDATAAERSISKGEAATLLVLTGVAALASESAEASVEGIKTSVLSRIAGLVYEKRPKGAAPDAAPEYVATLASYAADRGLSVEDALVRLVTVGLGREAALMHDRQRLAAGKPARQYRPRDVGEAASPDRPLVLGPWDAPLGSEGEQ